MKQVKTVLLLLFLTIFSQAPLRAVDCVEDSSGNPTCAAIIFNPTTLADIQSAIQQAITDGKQIRAFGGLHSQIDDVAVGVTNYLINMNGVNKILEINPSAMTIKVQGGINLYQLSHELAKVGMALTDQPGPYDATSGGMAANAVHESGLHGGLSDSILEIQIVDGMGNLRTVSQTSNPEWLPAARVSLGVLGIIYTVTFQCVPATRRHVFATVTTVSQILPQINQLLRTTDNFQFLANPGDGVALQQTFNIVQDQVTNNSKLKNYSKYLSQSLANSELSAVTTPLVPTSLYPVINDTIITSGAITDTTYGGPVIDFFYKSYSYFHASPTSRARIAEISVEAQFVSNAIADLMAIVQTYHNNGFDFLYLTEVRYVADQNFMYLSPYSTPRWSIGFILIFDSTTPAATNILRDFFNAMLKYNGRPEWGNNPEFLTYPITIQLYGQANVDAFNAVRRIFDPNGIFYTPYFVQRLGPL